MRRYLLLAVGMFIPVLSFAESTLSFGVHGNFGLMLGISNETIINGNYDTNVVNTEYLKSLIGIGFDLTGRFSGSSGWGGMGKMYAAFPLSYTHDINASVPNSTPLSSSRETYSNIGPGFVIGFGGGVLKRFIFSEKLVLAIDLGPEVQIDIIGIDPYHLLIIGAGVFSDLKLEYHINRQLYFDAGINLEVLAGGGTYRYQQANIQVGTGEFMFFISPGISIGYRF
jgi:hypothetical protein